MGRCSGILAVAVIAAAMLEASAPPAQAQVQQYARANTTAQNVCPPATPGHASCFAKVIASNHGRPLATSSYQNGYTPANLQSAYQLTGYSASAGTNRTIAIVDAYDDPNAASDLAVYRARFGLPACTVANGCFKKLNQNGQPSPLPRANTHWASEISLDLDMASAICPKCKIALIETNSNSLANLAAGVDRAVTLSHYISNSYGAPEFSTEAAFLASHYRHPGYVITASTGDDGFAAGAQVPAVAPTVVAVGGTNLYRRPNSLRGWEESAWSGAGSGCSAYIARPASQSSLTACPRRQVADVSAVADPYTGVAVYNTYSDDPGWTVSGGTSASAPIIASIYALAGNAATINAQPHPYQFSNHLYDVLTGANGICSSYLCTAGPGYDGPTGLGTPNGVFAF